MPFDGMSFDGMPADLRMLVGKPRGCAPEGSDGQPKERNYFTGAAWESGDSGDEDGEDPHADPECNLQRAAAASSPASSPLLDPAPPAPAARAASTLGDIAETKWQRWIDRNGRLYYFHIERCITTHEMPPEVALLQLQATCGSLKRSTSEAGIAPPNRQQKVRTVTSIATALFRNETTQDGRLGLREQQLAALGLEAAPRNFSAMDRQAWTKEERTSFKIQCQMHGATHASAFMRLYFRQNEGKPLPPEPAPRSAWDVFRTKRSTEQNGSAKQASAEWRQLSEERRRSFEAMWAVKKEEHDLATEAYEAALEEWERQKAIESIGQAQPAVTAEQDISVPPENAENGSGDIQPATATATAPAPAVATAPLRKLATKVKCAACRGQHRRHTCGSQTQATLPVDADGEPARAVETRADEDDEEIAQWDRLQAFLATQCEQQQELCEMLSVSKSEAQQLLMRHETVEQCVAAHFENQHDKSKSDTTSLKIASKPFEVGVRVEVLFDTEATRGCRYFRGVIKRIVTAGVYDVRFDDGDRKDCSQMHMRKLSSDVEMGRF